MLNRHPNLRAIATAVACVAVVLLAVGCGGGGPASDTAGDALRRPSLVVTTAILGSVVRELVGDAADVVVLMPSGVDPHDWQPSAKDVERVMNADLVVTNGLGLEESLDDALSEAESGGVPVIAAADFVDVRTIGTGELPSAEGEGHEGETVGAPDPHFWTDPLAIEAVIAGLSPALEQDLGLGVRQRATELEARLVALDEELRTLLSTIPPERRKLVTGHESMGYFADRYGFTLVGALIPSVSSQAEASAAELAALKEQIEQEGVTVVFTELGTPDQVAQAIADETGAEVVELPSHSLPEDGSYFTFERDLADRVAGALAP